MSSMVDDATVPESDLRDSPYENPNDLALPLYALSKIVHVPDMLVYW